MPEFVATNGKEAAKAAVDVESNANVEQPKKKFRRGITNETRTVSRLKYDESLANRANGLFLGVIDSVEVQEVEFKEDNNGMPSFAGETVPVFVVQFHSLHDAPEKWRWVPLRAMAAESNANTIPYASEAWKVENVTGVIKHLLDVVYLHGRPLNDEEEEALTLPFEDFTITEDGKFVYEPVDAKVVLAGYKQIFENAAAMLNGTWKIEPNTAPKPAYVNKDGKKTWYWLKLLRFTKVKNQWSPVVRGGNNTGDLGFPSFIGSGIFEKYEKDVAPSLRVDPSKESIIPQKWQKEPSAPKAPMGVAGGVPVGGVNPIFGGAGSEMNMGQSPVDYNSFADPTMSDDVPF